MTALGRYLLVGCLALIVSGDACHGRATAAQVLSPGTAPRAHQRNRSAAAGQNAQETPNPEPSRRLLVALDAMIPFSVTGSELEQPLLEAARTFLTGSTEEAEQMLIALREQRPDLPPAPALVANMLLNVGKTSLCRQWLEKAVTEYPQHPAAFLGFARFSAGNQRIADADAMLEKIRRLIDTGDWTTEQTKLFEVEYLDIRTDVLVFRRQYEAARAGLLELKRLLVNNGKVLVRLAQVEFDMGNVDTSLGYLRDAAALRESIRVPEVIIADWYRAKGQPAESERWITAAAEQYPDNVSVQTDYARWLLQNERFSDAGEVIRKAEQLGGDEYVIGYLKGQIAFAERAYDDAAMFFEQLLNVRPGDADATNMLALCLIENPQESRQSQALELAMMNRRLYPNSPTAMATLGWIYYRSGKTAESERAFQAVIASRNLAPVAAYYVASYLSQRGDLAGARNLLEQAVASQEYFMFRRAAEALLQDLGGSRGQAAADDQEDQQ
jgi:tetratricopeptide (TPR) repeat protein